MSDEKPKTKIPRIELQKAMGTEVKVAIDAAVEKTLKHFNLDPKDPDAQRRCFRAIVTLAAQKLFDMGCPAPIIAQQAFEAVAAEHKHRHQQALHQGQPFGPTPPAKA